MKSFIVKTERNVRKVKEERKKPQHSISKGLIDDHCICGHVYIPSSRPNTVIV